MRLLVTTPTMIVVEVTAVSALRAEDETGAFGILPGHADFLTVLSPSVLSWQDASGLHYVAVRGGVLRVEGGKAVEVATREAVASDDLPHLQAAVLSRFTAELAADREERARAARLELAAFRQIYRYLQAGRPGGGEISAREEIGA